MLTRGEVISKASSAIFGRPLVTNVYRSVITEAIVAAALPGWEWCSADYAACDFRHPNGTRLEVKQSAIKQSWTTRGQSKPSWDIAARTGYWEAGTNWVPMPGRNADIYVLCLHDVIDDTADHRDPAQWTFIVIPTHKLPTVKRIGLAAAVKLATPVKVDHLQHAIDVAEKVALPSAG